MLELKGLRLKGIGRFVEEQYIDVSALNDFIQVDAENHNTGGSSGSGKTTLFNALDYLFGINDLPNTVLQSRLTKEPMSVTGYFDWDGKPLEIGRSKAGLRIDMDGKLITGSSAIAEESLDQIIGMPRDLFRKILHKRQKEGGFFLDFTPKKMHEFLADCTNLGELRKKSDIVEKKIADLLKKVDSLRAELSASKTGLNATLDGILALGLAPVRDMHQSVILELKAKLDKANDAVKSAKTLHAAQLADLEKERPQTTVVAFDRKEIELLEKYRKEQVDRLTKLIDAEKTRVANVKAIILQKNSEKQTLNQQLKNAELAKQEAIRVAEQVKKIRANTCPTCDQHWSTDGAKVTEQDLLQKLQQLKATISLGTSTISQLADLDAQLAKLAQESAPVVPTDGFSIQKNIDETDARLKKEKEKEHAWLESQNYTNRCMLADFAAKQKALTTQQSQEMQLLSGQLDVDRRAFDAAVAKLKAYDEAKVRYEKSYLTLKEKEEIFTKQISDKEKTINSIESELVLAEDAKKAIKTFISFSFDDALDIIGDNATKIIRCIPNMSNATLQFEGTKETKDGRVKEEVNAVIGMDGEVGIPIKSLSGGERSAVDLAVDLAVIDFIESRTQKGMNIFILDEPFTGLGTVEIEMALEVLKNSNTNKKLIIVDHNAEVKQMVQNRLVVVRDGMTSRIIQ